MAEAVEVGNASPHPTIPERSAEAAIGEAVFLTEPKPGQVRMRVTATDAQVIGQRRCVVALSMLLYGLGTDHAGLLTVAIPWSIAARSFCGFWGCSSRAPARAASIADWLSGG
jgi:hypothetical protein